MTLAINQQTARQLKSYLSSPQPVLVLLGAEGSGQTLLIEQVAAELLNTRQDKLYQNTSLVLVERPADKKDIPIEAVRHLITKLRIKSFGRRVVIIKEADKLNIQSQNALLKTLEQPPAETFFVLSTSQPLLPTVMSRAQIITVRPISLEAAVSHYKDYSDEEVKSAWAISEGAAGLLDELIANQADNVRGSAITMAKQFITSPKYERLIKIDELSKDRQTCLEFLSALSTVLKALHHAKINRDGLAGKQFLESRRAVERTAEVIAANGLSKLALLGLVVNLTV
jgi:DNA polymerase III delta prime subunit